VRKVAEEGGAVRFSKYDDYPHHHLHVQF